MHVLFFFFNDTATTEIYTLSLHDALPISRAFACGTSGASSCGRHATSGPGAGAPASPSRRSVGAGRSEEHTSELQSRSDLVCRLLLEKKKTDNGHHDSSIPRQRRWPPDVR